MFLPSICGTTGTFDRASLSKSAGVLPCRGKGVSAGGGGAFTGAGGGDRDVRGGGGGTAGGVGAAGGQVV